MKKLVKELSQTLVMIAHNEEIAKLSDRIVYIKNGKIEKEIRNKYV